MQALLIDPGSSSSALVEATIDRNRFGPPWGILPTRAEDLPNEQLRYRLRHEDVPPVLVIECAQTVFAQGAGADVLVAERWAGRFIEAFEFSHHFDGTEATVIECARATAKAAALGRPRGSDSEVRRALIDAYGGDRAAFGVRCKRCKGKGWFGAGRPACEQCGGSGWEVPEGSLSGWVGSHVFAALALGFAAFEPGGLVDQVEGSA